MIKKKRKKIEDSMMEDSAEESSIYSLENSEEEEEGKEEDDESLCDLSPEPEIKKVYEDKIVSSMREDYPLECKPRNKLEELLPLYLLDKSRLDNNICKFEPTVDKLTKILKKCRIIPCSELKRSNPNINYCIPLDKAKDVKKMIYNFSCIVWFGSTKNKSKIPYFRYADKNYPVRSLFYCWFVCLDYIEGDLKTFQIGNFCNTHKCIKPEHLAAKKRGRPEIKREPEIDYPPIALNYFEFMGRKDIADEARKRMKKS